MFRAGANLHSAKLGAVDVEVPPFMWNLLSGASPHQAVFGGTEYPWSDEGEGPVTIVTEVGVLRCWKSGTKISACAIGWGERGDPDGPTRDTLRKLPEV